MNQDKKIILLLIIFVISGFITFRINYVNAGKIGYELNYRAWLLEQANRLNPTTNLTSKAFDLDNKEITAKNVDEKLTFKWYLILLFGVQLSIIALMIQSVYKKSKPLIENIDFKPISTESIHSNI